MLFIWHQQWGGLTCALQHPQPQAAPVYLHLTWPWELPGTKCIAVLQEPGNSSGGFSF